MTDRRFPGVLFVGFLTLYLCTLCPTVYFGDSGEISAAIFRGGIIHPPGYPLFSLLGRLFLVLVPLGEPAFRVGCLVALAAAIAVVVVYALARKLQQAPLVAASVASLFGVSYTFWSQSVRVEVYSLHLLLCVLTLLFTLRYRDTQRPRDFLLACLSLSLGLAHHLTILLMLPGLLVLLGKTFWTRPRLAKRLGAGLTLLLIGPSLYLFLMLWAHDSTLYNVFDPSTPTRLWYHASARFYQGQLGLPTSTRPFRQALQIALRCLPAPLWLLVLGGCGALYRRDRTVLLALLGTALLFVAYNLCYKIPDIAPYYLLAVLMASLLLGEGFTELQRRYPLLPARLLALAPLALGLTNFPSCDLHSATFMREFARQKLLSCAPNAVLIVQGDQDLFPTDYVQQVLGVRPDVLVLAREHTSGIYFSSWETSRWYLNRLRVLGVDAPLLTPQSEAERRELVRDGYLIRLLEGPLAGRPLHLTFLESPTASMPLDYLKAWWEPRFVPVPQGLLFHLHPLQPPPNPHTLALKNRRLWKQLPLPYLGEVELSQESDPLFLQRHYLLMLGNKGKLWELAGNLKRAKKIYQTMRQWPPRPPRTFGVR
jgi:hypothetical protein